MSKRRHQLLLLTVIAALTLAGSCVYPTYDEKERAAVDEQHSVWQYLKIYSIYQDLVPNPPLGSLTPYDMFDLIHDTLHGGRYTEYIDDRPGGGVLFPPDTEFDDPLSFTDSTVYFHIPEFSKPALSAFQDNLRTLSSYPNIIIDVRDNGGGYLSVADAILGELLPHGTRYIKNKYRRYNRRERVGETAEDTSATTTPRPALPNKRIAVLMNGWSASASEILAAGLKDGTNGRAYLIGSRSYGKGIGQVIFDDRGEGRKGLSITFLNISGLTERTGQYHRVGIEPDPVPTDIANEVDAHIPSAGQQEIIQKALDDMQARYPNISESTLQQYRQEYVAWFREPYYALKRLEPGFTFAEDGEDDGDVDGMGKSRMTAVDKNVLTAIKLCDIMTRNRKAKASWRPMGAVVIDKEDLPNIKLSDD